MSTEEAKPAAVTPAVASDKQINSLVLDAGPLITQSFQTLHNMADHFYTTPSVLTELKDDNSRANLLLWGDQLVIRQPKAASVKAVSDVARSTGDYGVLSSTDIALIALGYEIDVELHGGVEHLQPAKQQPQVVTQEKEAEEETEVEPKVEEKEEPKEDPKEEEEDTKEEPEDDGWETVTRKTKAPKKQNKKIGGSTFWGNSGLTQPAKEDKPAVPFENDSENDSDDGEWITPQNLQESLLKDAGQVVDDDVEPEHILAATSTGDFAMQNVILKMGLVLVNATNGRQIQRIRNSMLRCHGCFHLMPYPKDGSVKHFCPKCGGNTLMRCSVTVGNDGKIQVHLKKKMNWSTRGNKYTLPKPQSKNSRQQRQPEFNDVLLREDQKEYAKALKSDDWKRRQNEKILDHWIGGGSAENVMSPFAATGSAREATRHTGVKVGRGRYVNSNKKNRK
ncbi:20S-pre-rRNA D-site endonuclease NOB1 [Yarrowia sp. C11]|nr:20S-pre-rRNA D-site endonuclease NOB1 [Yarrowia sp. C11]KAG5364366.1 20S-pre-rRNA D-site endonuclease NOB1 [Yarrowia sp. E02]